MIPTNASGLPFDLSPSGSKDAQAECLLVVAHPRLESSRVNRALLEAASGDARIRIHDLYELYPDYQIDVAAEQQTMLSHGVIGLQFPLFWYAMPALLKEWFDLVWLHGFAYGGGAPKLAGRTLFCVTTAGGDDASYGPRGRNAHPVADFLRPIERTAALCGMKWLEPWVVHDAPSLTGRRLEASRTAYGDHLGTILRSGRTE